MAFAWSDNIALDMARPAVWWLKYKVGHWIANKLGHRMNVIGHYDTRANLSGGQRWSLLKF